MNLSAVHGATGLPETAVGTKVALFLPALSGGGAERVMLHIASGLADNGLSVDLVLARAEGPYMTHIPSTVRLVDLKARQTLFSLPALTAYLKAERPVALLSALDHANVVAAVAVRRSRAPVRLLMSIHNTLSVSHANAKSWKDKVLPACLRMVHPWVDAIIAVSKGVADDFSNMTQIPRERVSVINNPVVGNDLLTQAAAPLDHKWFAAGEPPVIVSVGRLTEQKDFGNLLRAFAKAREKRAIRLLILGDGPDRQSLTDLAGELGISDDIEMPGFVENPYSYMAKAGAFVLSSRWEGLPTVLIEAMASGAPVVSTDCPSGPREILQDGRYGVLVPVGDSNALADGIVRMLSEDREDVRPPDESWAAYRRDVGVNNYMHAMLGTKVAAQ